MGTFLKYGYWMPAPGDTGDVWFPNMAANVTLQNNHTHNGSDGAILAVQLQNILSSNWGSATNGTYTQTITMPIVNAVQMSYDSTKIEFRLSTGEPIYPSVTRLSTTQYTISTNDNTQSYVAVYR